MRKIATFPTLSEAEKFRWFLLGHAIACHQDTEDTDEMSIWVLNDDDLARGRQLLQLFQQTPNDTPVTQMVAQGRKSYEHQEKLQKKHAGQRKPSSYSSPMGNFPVTSALIVVAVLVFLLSFLAGRNSMSLSRLSSAYLSFSMLSGHGFWEIKEGQIWRLFTPIFLHEGLLHIFFNMMWLWLLGRQIEAEESSRKLSLLTLIVAAVSNSAFYLVAGPHFGGMSGVNYGLAAYLWFMGQWGGVTAYRNEDNQSQFFLVWYILCLVLTIFGMRVANTIHGVGAACGFLVALFSSRKGRHLPRFLLQQQTLRKQCMMGLLLLAAGMVIDSISY